MFEAAKSGFRAHGVELNPWLVLYSKFRARRLGLAAEATFARQDLWKSDFRRYDNVVIFGVEQMMPALEEKLATELRKSSRQALSILSYIGQFSGGRLFFNHFYGYPTKRLLLLLVRDAVD